MHSRFDHATQRHVMTDTRPPANAFEWKRYLAEEAARRGDTGVLDPGETSRKRSVASTKAAERNRLGVVPTDLTPRKFHIYNQIRKDNAK